jgi:V8-like Glu-specific endopeptidase
LGICTRFHCSNRYTILKDKSDDWAIVKIDEPLGDRLEIIPMIYSTMIQTNQAMQVEIPGFPGEVQGRVTFDMWTATDTHLVLPNNEKLQYVITTSGGQSGAPVLISQPSVFGEASYYAVGIHTSGGNQCNYARAIDRDLYDTIWTFWI